MKNRSFLLVPIFLAACAGQPVAPSVPAALVPSQARTLERLHANGVQIYQCRAKAGGAPEWAFVAPEADLVDTDGRAAGRHYAGPRWEAPDGSKILGAVAAKADAPQAGAIPWLLLSARSVGGEGRFAHVTSVQRVNTQGGVAPARACDAGSLGATERVPYTADYILFVATTAAYMS